jgi:hypothetical protein
MVRGSQRRSAMWWPREITPPFPVSRIGPQPITLLTELKSRLSSHISESKWLCLLLVSSTEVIMIEVCMGQTAYGQLQLPYTHVHTLFPTHTTTPSPRTTPRYYRLQPKWENLPKQTLYEVWYHKASGEGLTSGYTVVQQSSRCPLQAIKLSLTPHTSTANTKTSSAADLLFASCYCNLCCLIFQHLPCTFLFSKWPVLHRWWLKCTMIVCQ